MPCPFPGMDPYIERDAIWGDFQWSLAIRITGALQPLLKPGLAAISSRLLIDDENERFQIEALIVEAADVTQVITAIGILCPENKRDGRGRQAYLDRRAHYQAAGANVVDIDLLRGGVRIGAWYEKSSSAGPTPSYEVCVTRGPLRIEIYAVQLPQRLPKIAVPLVPSKPDVVLDLQAVFSRVWEEGPYPELLNYDQPPPGDLSDDEQRWCREQLVMAGYRSAG